MLKVDRKSRLQKSGCSKCMNVLYITLQRYKKKCEKTYGFSTFNFTLYIGINGLIPDIGTHYLMDDYYYGRNKKKSLCY